MALEAPLKDSFFWLGPKIWFSLGKWSRVFFDDPSVGMEYGEGTEKRYFENVRDASSEHIWVKGFDFSMFHRKTFIRFILYPSIYQYIYFQTVIGGLNN